MKLYATVTSERATKGQGGNEQLHIEVKGEQQTVIFEFEVTPHEDCYEIEGYAIDENSIAARRSEQYFVFRPNKKGEKQKSEYCAQCMSTPCQQE